MNRFAIRLIVLSAAMMAVPVASTLAKDIYVAPTGNDTAAGTMDQPLLTVQKAADSAQPGDVVTLRAGEYREAVQLKAGGEEGKPITFQAAANEQATIKGSVLVTNWVQHAPGIWKLENWPTNSQQLFIDGQPLQQIGVQNRWNAEKLWANYVCLPPVGKDLNDVKPGTFFYDKESKTLYTELADQSDPKTHKVEASVNDFVFNGNGQSYITLHGLSFMHSNSTGSNQREAELRITGQGWNVDNCQITYADFAGVGISGEHHTISHCKIDLNGDVGVDMNGSDAAHQYRWYATRPPMSITVEDSEICQNNYRKFFDQWHGGGFKCVPCARGITIRNNNISNNQGAGVWFDGGLGSNRVENNLVADNITGIFYEISGPAEGDEFGATIRNNRVARSLKQGIYISASRGAIVENNTCYQNNWDIVVHGMPRKEFGGQHLMNDVIRNNIVDGNFFVNSDGSPAMAQGGFSPTPKGYDANVIKDLAKMRAAGFEKEGSAGNPMWINAENLDFHLKPGSTATGKGWQAKE